jgi:hypothetical protein
MEKREEIIFAAALEVPVADRMAFLNQACGSEVGLFKRLTDLLRSLEEAGGFLEEPASDVKGVTKELRENNELLTGV